MKRKKYNAAQILRHIIQLAAFIAIPGLFILILNAISSIYQSILYGSFSVSSEAASLLILLAVIPITIVWGRFFCGYLCAFGSMQELLGFIARKLHIPQITVSSITDRRLKAIKIIVLGLLIAAWTLKISIDTIDPWQVFGVYSSYKSWTSFSSLLTVGGLLLILIIAASLLSERFFCKYLCPLGGIFSAISGIRLFKIKKSRTACTSCGLCSVNCPMNIDVNKVSEISGRVRSGECIDCFRCTNICPHSALKTTPTEAFSGTVAALAITGIYYAGTIPANAGRTTASQATLSQGKYTDGTYHGTSQGYRGNIEVTVIVGGGSITSITVDSYEDDAQFFNTAKSTVISEILSSQSTDIDTVSGATFSSRGIINAVADALGTGTASAVEQPVTSEADAAESASSSDTAANNSGSFSDGTYTGTGSGRNGDVVVSVTVSGGNIISINIESSSEDAPYLSRAASVIDSILDSQSIDVQTISGATMSSNGIIDAVADALNLDFTNSNSSISKGGGHGKH